MFTPNTSDTSDRSGTVEVTVFPGGWNIPREVVVRPEPLDERDLSGSGPR